MSASFTIQGAEQLTANLAALEDKLRKKILRAASRKASKVVIRVAAARAPEETGLLKLGIGARIKLYRGGETVAAIIGPLIGQSKKLAAKKAASGPATSSRSVAYRDPGYYGHLVEGGTKPHAIAAAGGVLAFAGIVTKTVDHPGAKPNPFLEPAFNDTVARAQQVMADEIGAGIHKAMQGKGKRK